MKKLLALVILAGFVLQSASGAVDLKQSKLTQIVNTVEIISSNTRHTAEVNDVFKMPDVMRTGAGARAEMIADDGTITRVGANTIFSFDPAERTIDLQQGSLLFHAPHGLGGGTIHTGSATASVIGTTIIVTTTPNGGFKVLDLEGEAEIRFLNGLKEKLAPGQMTFILPGGGASPVLVFRLDVQTQGSLLINGFTDPLPSFPNIQVEITRQLRLLLDDRIQDTDLVVGDNATPQEVQVVMNLQDHLPPNAAVIGSDHTANQPLPVNYAPLQSTYIKGDTFTGNNVDIDTAKINLSAYSGAAEFDFKAINTLRIWQSLNFNGDNTTANYSSGLPDTIGLIAGDTMEIAAGSTLEADTGTFELNAGSFAVLDTTTGQIAEGGDNTLDGVAVYNYDGDAEIVSVSDLTWDDGGYVYAGGKVDIDSYGTLNLGYQNSISTAGYNGGDFTARAAGDVDLTSIGGDININDSDIYAGYDYSYSEDATTSGGNVNIIAAEGNVNIYDSEIYAYADDNSGEGDVSISTPNGGVSVMDSDIYGDADVAITSGQDVVTGSDLSVTPGTINIQDADVYAGEGSYGGNVNINAYNGNVTVDDADIYAYSEDNSGEGFVNINAYEGGVTIEDADIYADEDVTITSSGSSSTSGVDIEDADIYAGYDLEDDEYSSSPFCGNVYITANNGNVTINDSDIYAYSGDNSAGNVNVYASGTGDVEDTYIEADGSVSIQSEGSLTLGYNDSDEIYTYGGPITLISDNGGVYVDYDLYSAGDIDITSGQPIPTGDSAPVSDSGIDIEDSEIYAADEGSIGGNVNINAYNGGVTINDSDVYAYSDDNSGEGFVNINAYEGEVSINYSDVYAGEDLSISSSGGGSSTGIDIENSYLEAGYDDSIGGNINLNAGNGEVALYSDHFNANSDGNSDGGNITINANNGDVYINGSDIFADQNVSVMSSGTDYGTGIDIEDSDLEAGYDDSFGGNVYITANNGNVTINDSDIYAYSGDNSAGNVNVYASGTGDVEDTYIEADGSVSVESEGSLTLGYNSSDEIDAYGGPITLLSDNGGVYVDYDLYSAGDIDITSGQPIPTGDSAPVSDSGIDIEDSEIYAADEGSIGGNVNINAYNGGVTINNSDVYAYDRGYLGEGSIKVNAYEGGVSISDSEIYADEDLSITSGGTGSNTGIDIEGSDLEAGYDDTMGGNVNINANNGNLYLYDDDIYAYANDSSAGNVNIYASGTGDVEDAYIEADGSVSIESEGSLTLGYNSSDEIDAYGGPITLTSHNGGVYVDYDLYSAGDIDITSGQPIPTGDSAPVSDSGIDIEDSEIYAADEGSIGGNVNINAYNGGVTINDSDVYAYSDDYSGEGFINVNAYEGGVLVNDSDVYAGEDVSIISSGTGSSTGIDIEDSYLEAGYDDSLGGNVYIEANNGNVTISDADIYAYSGTSGAGNVSVYATGTGDIEDTYIDAEGDVSITSQGSLTLGYDESEEIDATGSINLLSDTSDVYVDYELDAGGDVDITSGSPGTLEESTPVGGNVDVENSSIYAGDSSLGGNVNITAYNGNVTINYSDIYAYSGESESGEVDIYGNNGVSMNGNGVQLAEIDTENTVEGDDGVYITAANSDATIDGYILEGNYGEVSIRAYNGNVNMDNDLVEAGYDDTTTGYNADIMAGENVSITDYSEIEASGNVNICANGTTAATAATADTTDGTGIGAIDIEDSDIYAGESGTSEPSGSVNINAYNGGVNLYDDGVYAYSSGISASQGSINVYAADNVAITGGSYVEADGDVSITTGTSYGKLGDAPTPPPGSGAAINIQDSYIYAGGIDSDSISGGSAIITANDGDVYLGGDDIEAYSGEDSTSGNVNIYATGAGDIEDTYVYADNTVDIETSDTLTLNNSGTAQTIEGQYGVTLTSDSGDVSINNYDVQADYAGLNISAGGDIDINGNSGIYAGYDDSNPDAAVLTADGSVNITGGSIVDASGDVSISAGETSSGSSVYVDNSEIYAGNGSSSGGSVYIVAGGNVSIEDGSDVYAANDVNITGGQAFDDSAEVNPPPVGTVDIENSDIEAGYDNTSTGGNVNITAYNGNAYLYNDTVGAGSADGTTGGNINVTADGNIDVLNTSLSAYNQVSLTSNDGYVNVYDSYESGDLTLTYWNISAGTEVDLSADNTLDIDGSTIYAYDGNVNIETGGEITPSRIIPDNRITLGQDSYGDDTDIQASGSVNMTANGGGINILQDSTVYAAGGDVNLTSTSEAGSASYIDIDASLIEANGNVSMNSGGDITIQDGSLISASTGDAISAVVAPSSDSISISSGGTLTVDGDGGDNYDINGNYTGYDIGADDNVYLWGNYGVNINNAVLTTLGNDSSSEVTIEGYDGDVDITGNSSITSGGSVWVESTYGNVNITDSYITANSQTFGNGGIYISADNGTLTIDAGHNFTPGISYKLVPDIASYNGDAEFYGDAVNISDTTISADQGVTVDSSDGDVDITDVEIGSDGAVGYPGDVDMHATSGNLNLDSGMSNHGVILHANGSVNLGADDDVNIDDTEIYANNGNISITSGGTLSLGDGPLTDGVWVEAENGGSITMSANFGATIYDSYISGGDVSISSGYTLSITGGEYYGSISGKKVKLTAYNDLSISAEDVTANNGDVTITAGYNADAPAENVVNYNSSYYPAYVGFSESTVTPANTYNESLDASASGDVNVIGSGTANEYTGNINLQAGDTVTISDQGLIAGSGDVDLTADSGDIDITGDSTSAQTTILQALAGNVNLTADNGAVNVTDGDLEADNGNVNITASGDVNLTDTIINASAAVSISSGESLSIDEGRTAFAGDFSDGVDIYGGNTITMTALNATIQQASLYSQSDLDVTATDGNLTVEDTEMASQYGNIDLSAQNGTLTLEEGPVSQGIYIEAGDSVSLNGDNSVAISASTIYADSGDISITSNGTASGGISIDSSYLESYGNLSITSTGNISLTDDESEYGGGIEGYNGNVTIESTGGTVYANNTDVYANGDINISAGEAISKTGALPSDSLDIENSYIESDYGSINFDSTGDTFLYDSDVFAGDNVTVDSQGSVGLQGAYVSANNTISLTSEQSDVDIGGGTIVATEGDSLTINAPNGNVNILNGSIIPAVAEEGPDSNPILAVEYTSEGEAEAVIDISSDSDITASGNVYVTANGGDISISGQNVNISDTDFYFGSQINISGSTIDAGDGDVDITSKGTLAINGPGTESGNTIYGGAISISDSLITASSGDVNIENQISSLPGFTSSESDIDISDSEITANADLATGLIGGVVNISTPGNVDITGSTLSGNASVATPSDYDVNITAGGYVNVLDSYSSSDLTADNWDVTGGTYVTLAGDNNLTVSGSTITADAGDVTLRSGTAIITGTVPATYDLSINGGADIGASGSAYAYANEGDADIYNSTLTAGGNVIISASGNADIENDVISADNPSETDYTAGSSVESPSIDISSTDGNIDISADGTVTLIGDTFNLGDDINISGTTLIATSGDVDISAGEFNVYGTTINLSGCTFNDGNIDISTGSLIESSLGNVYITAGNNITIGNSTISATPGGTDTDLFSGLDTSSGTLTLTADGGNIDITAQEGGVVLSGSTFNLGGNINISDDETVSSTSGDVDITAGELSISAGGTIDLSSDIINGGQINISEESSVTAAGSVNLNAQAVNIFDSTVTAANNVNITATGAVDISSAASPDTSITANGTAVGNGITVNAQDGITVSGASLSANTSTGTITLNNGTSGQVVVNNGSSVQTAYLDINSAQGVLIDGTGGRFSGKTMNVKTSLGTTADDANNGHTVTVQNADLSGFAQMNVQGHTVNMNKVNFSSSSDYNFTSFYHGYYVNNGNVAGYVNFNNDTLNGTTAITGTGPSTTLNPVNNGGIELGGTGAGIHVN